MVGEDESATPGKRSASSKGSSASCGAKMSCMRRGAQASLERFASGFFLEPFGGLGEFDGRLGYLWLPSCTIKVRSSWPPSRRVTN